MATDKRLIYVIGLTVLESLAIKYLIHEQKDIHTESYFSFIESLEDSENADGYIITPEMFVKNIDFFLPKRGKILVVYSNGEGNESPNPYLSISITDDEILIREKLNRFLGTLSEEEKGAGELSVREKEVLHLIAEGKLNKEIADLLCISINTVITHRKNISSKLGIKSTSGLSLYALMNGII